MQAEASSSSGSKHVPERFTTLIWSCLDASLHRSAVFYAERYFAMYPSSHDARHLYATVLLKSGQPHTAHHLVNLPGDTRCSGCLQIKSECCTALGRHRQARDALEECMKDSMYAPSPSMASRSAAEFPTPAIMHCRSGAAAVKGNLPEQARASFKQALKLNPLLWEAFEALCSLGNVPPIDELFPPRLPPTQPSAEEEAFFRPASTGAGFFTPAQGSNGNLFHMLKGEANPPAQFRMGAAGPRDSIGSTDSSFFVDESFQFKAPAIPASRSQPGLSNQVQPPAHAATSSRSTVAPSKATREQTAFGLARRSSRLLGGNNMKPKLVPKNNAKDRRRVPARTRPTSESEMDDEPPAAGTAPIPTPGSEASTAQGNPEALQQPSLAAQEAYEIELADYAIYDLVRMCASATRALAIYECRTCLDELEKLPSEHQRSAWTMAMVGKAHYELGEYSAAERAFEAVRNLEPYRLWDMEFYSTLLWHLQRHVKLSFLAQELLAINPRSSEAWIAVGNCFSLQKERSQALTCFHRAAQLDPTCAYAYTLSGHESIDEDLDKAVSFFQTALRADSRHYNAWYGLGTCYMRMSKLRLAEYHYGKAAEIHPQNAVLLGCVGMVKERQGRLEAALGLFNQAVQLSQDNALVRYHRAKVLIAMKKYKLAAQDLEALRDTSPDESNVIFQLAKVYRLMGDKVKSAQTLAVARDVSPKSLNKIRKLLETVKDESADDVMDEG